MVAGSCSQALMMISGPMPAGSPMLRAMGRGAVVAVIVAWGWVVAGMVFACWMWGLAWVVGFSSWI